MLPIEDPHVNFEKTVNPDWISFLPETCKPRGREEHEGNLIDRYRSFFVSLVTSWFKE
jgi:hypothetical protein